MTDFHGAPVTTHNGKNGTTGKNSGSNGVHHHGIINRHRRSKTVTEHSPEFKLISKKAQSFSGKFFARSHLLNDFPDNSGNFLSLWLLPPDDVRKSLMKEVTKLSLRYNSLKSSAPFTPHVTILGSISCGEGVDEMRRIGKTLQRALSGSGPVPCRFRPEPCSAMYREDGGENKQIVWSQSCIAIMERSPEFIRLLDLSRDALKLPPGEWIFPAPAREPHMSKFYGHAEIPVEIPTSPDFVATEAALFCTTPGTVEGVQQWKEVARISLEDPL